MTELDPIQKDPNENRITTITGFAGLSLTILTDAISTIDFDEFNGMNIPLQLTFSISALGFIMCFICGLAAFAKVHHVNVGNVDLEKLLKSSYMWLCLGIAAISMSIALTITRSFNWAVIFMFIIICAVIWEMWITKVDETNQPLTKL